jgi:hypothetical protein
MRVRTTLKKGGAVGKKEVEKAAYSLEEFAVPRCDSRGVNEAAPAVLAFAA